MNILNAFLGALTIALPVLSIAAFLTHNVADAVYLIVVAMFIGLRNVMICEYKRACR